MKKKTKELLMKIGVGLTALISGGFLLFSKKTETTEKTKEINKKGVGDTDLFI